jgi:hypothetical protein
MGIMLRVEVKVIPHKEQRYDTVGDWWFEPDTKGPALQIRVSNMGDWRYEYLVAQHEQNEAMLCFARCISGAEVTVFDIMYEDRRRSGDSEFQGECGDHALAPYRKEHFFATTQERAMAAELGVDWSEYEEAVNSL